MTKIDTTPSSPVLIRTYKKEAELEVWKMNSQGQYARLKTYPMCRWSGQLGPKKREGDMQVPEGFYTIAPGQMNPNSHYYLAFNVGYPNAYDRALGRDGGSVMVHGVCSSAGCFSMTDEQVADIYAVARDAFRGGQREIQLQSYPFHMTAENMAKYRLDPNIAFWKEIKKGSDYFEVTKVEPPIVVCNKHYEFGVTPKGPVSATAACPQLERDDAVEQQIAEKELQDEAKEEHLAATGLKAIRTIYADGGQNPLFTGYKDTSDPESLVGGPQEIVLDDRVPAAVRVAAAQADAKRQRAGIMARINGTELPSTPAEPPADARVATAKSADAPVKAVPAPTETGSIVSQPTQPTVQTVALVAPVAQASEPAGGMLGASTRNVKKWLNWGGGETSQSAATAQVPADTAIATPLPPSREATVAQADKSKKPQKARSATAKQASAGSEKSEAGAQSTVTQ